MAAQTLPVPARVKTLCAPRIGPLLSFAAAFLSLVASLAHGLGVNETGRWTPPPTTPWPATAVHMALLPGDGSRFHSKVLYWEGLNDEEGPFGGGLWGWRPPEYGCTTYPDTNVLRDISLPVPAGGVFCGGNSHLATGELFVPGGTQPGTENGVRHVYLFDPVQNTWALTDSMNALRWYNSSTTLADSRVLVTSGSKYVHIEFFGGLQNSEIAPADSALFRYGMGGNGVVDEPVRQSATPREWPSPREGHTTVSLGASTIHLFGGKDRLGHFRNDYWQINRGENRFGPDYDYQWVEQRGVFGNPPAKRWHHSAVGTPSGRAWMIMFGGIARSLEDTTLDVVMDDVWRLWFDGSGHGLTWTPVHIQSSAESPGARSDHIAVWDDPRQRMLMFGGRGTAGAAPNDSALWSLNFSATYDTATWSRLDAVGPSARMDHAITEVQGQPSRAFLFGGELASGAKSNDLWRLNIGDTTTWEAITDLGGTYPSPRSGHTATAIGRLLVVLGGIPNDPTVYVAHLESHGGGELRQWTTFTANPVALTGHTAIPYTGPFERIPEIYNPAEAAGHRWTQLTNAPHLQDWYPQTFVWKADTVFVSGPDEFSYKLSLSGQTWPQYPEGTSGFRGGSAVMYRPGKVMKCGSRDTEGPHLAVGATAHIDLGLQSAGQWENSSNEMLARVNHNLVLLPNGQVLVVGGNGYVNDDADSLPVLQPEIWDPDYNNGQGRWSGNGVLAWHQVHRDYHSTALLLPDGRVLCSSGNGNETARHSPEIFCPPYLFNGSSLAVRPALAEAPRVVRYGAQHSLCMATSVRLNDPSRGLEWPLARAAGRFRLVSI